MFKEIAALSALALAACTTNSPPAADKALTTSPSTVAAPLTAAPAAASEAPEQVEEATTSLTRIADPSTVCMVNDQHMGVPQIPVQVEGKTYYGCCQMCEAKLKQNEQARLGTDPVTKNAVDKATAVLAMDAKGKVMYFESEASMRSYSAAL